MIIKRIFNLIGGIICLPFFPIMVEIGYIPEITYFQNCKDTWKAWKTAYLKINKRI